MNTIVLNKGELLSYQIDSGISKPGPTWAWALAKLAGAWVKQITG